MQGVTVPGLSLCVRVLGEGCQEGPTLSVFPLHTPHGNIIISLGHLRATLFRETETQSLGCAHWLHLCSNKTHFSILAASVPPQHNSDGVPLPAALPAPHTAHQCMGPLQAIPLQATKGCLSPFGGYTKGAPWAWHGKSFRATPVNDKHINQGFFTSGVSKT